MRTRTLLSWSFAMLVAGATMAFGCDDRSVGDARRDGGTGQAGFPGTGAAPAGAGGTAGSFGPGGASGQAGSPGAGAAGGTAGSFGSDGVPRDSGTAADAFGSST